MTRARGNTHDKLKKHGRPIRNQEDILARAFAPRQNPLPAPTPAIEDAPYVCLIVNVEWVSHVLGVLETLNQPDAWQGDEDEKHRSQGEIQRLLEMLMTGDACMIDPCCPETNEILTEIKVLNQTIVNNQVTIINNQEIVIDNDTTIINQNDQTIVNNLYQQFNQYETINQNYLTLNQMLYDGTPQSLAPSIGETWNGDDTENTLCNAVKNYVDYAIYSRTAEVNQDALAIGAVSAAFVAACMAGAAPTAGISAAIGMVVAGVSLGFGLSVNAWNNSVQDPEGRRKVVCCMYDGLKDQNVSLETFKASVNDCGFDVGTSESNIAALVNGCNQIDYNFEAFLRAMNTSGIGSAADCACGCAADTALEDFSGTGCTITPMGNCIYRFTQSTVTETSSPPEGRRYFSFRDIMLRCLKVEFAGDPYPLPSTGGCTTIGCCGQGDYNGDSFGGGFAPTTLISVNWWTGGDNTEPQYYKITLQDMEECE